MLSGTLDVELIPQGSLVKDVEAGGAGIHFHSRIWNRSWEGKEVREFNEETHILDKIDTICFVKSRMGDTAGNLILKEQ